jgi:hypothetical protein
MLNVAPRVSRDSKNAPPQRRTTPLPLSGVLTKSPT